MKKSIFLLICCGTWLGLGAQSLPSRKEVIQVIYRVNDYWQQSHPDPERAFWDEAAYHTGNMEAYQITGKDAYRAYSEDWAIHNEWKGAKSEDKSAWKYNYGETDDHVLFGDWQVCFQTYLDLYRIAPEERKIARAKEVMDYEISTDKKDYWWWVDGLYMVMPVMTKLYHVMHDERYLDKLHEYFQYAKQLMYDPETKLFYRDAKYIYPKHQTVNGKKDFWARGDGWLFAGLAKILTDLPKDHAHRAEYESLFQDMAATLLKAQQAEGYWTRSLLDPEHAPGYETSGTAFFTYGLFWGINHGLLDRDRYLPAAQKAWHYLQQVALQANGKVGYIQPIGEKAIPGQVVDVHSEANFGVGAFLLAACELTRFLDGKQDIPHQFEIGHQQFLLDGKPFQIISGEMHYARIPRPYWRDRLKKAKAMGLNTVCTYMFWNAHEAVPGHYDFSDNLDIHEFCRIAREEGLWVIVRPGPYACAEWDLGGLPSWLLKKKGVVLRSSDPNYMPYSLRFLKRAAEEIRADLITQGGNVLMVQVENEYGVYSDDKQYLEGIKTTLLDAGIDVPLFHCDWAGKNYYDKAHLEGVMPAINFGGGAQKNFQIFETYAPDVPRFNSEFWTGWFDYWGGKHEVHSVEEKLADFKWMIDQGISVNLYMFHGGTSNGFFPGANGSNTYYTPYITSYDYDALLNENGEPNEKFFAFQRVIQEKFPDLELPELPEPLKKISIPEIQLTSYGSLMDNLPQPSHAEHPQTMEELDQASGLILYAHAFEGAWKGKLEIRRVMDRATVYVDGKNIGVLDRRTNQKTLALQVAEGAHRLEILVEHQARVNFGNAIDQERKGITEGVFLNGKALLGWEQYSIPLTNTETFKASSEREGYPHLYRASFQLSEVGDTYLDTRNLDKGLLWVNGKLIGRYWFIGPQQTLFTPGCWLKAGENELQVLEMGKPKARTIRGIATQIWETKVDSSLLVSKGAKLNPNPERAIYQGTLPNQEGWQEVSFGKASEGRYVLFESRSAYGNVPYTTVAELRLLDEHGTEIPREEYTVLFADSEEAEEENGLASLVIDNQPTTFWHTQWSKGSSDQPHQVLIDIARPRKISGFRYLPRTKEIKGRIKEIKVYLSKEPFKLKKS